MSETVNYTVRLPSNHLTLARIQDGPGGTVIFNATVPGPGKLDVLETAWDSTEATAASLLRPAPLRFVYARLYLDVRRGGSTHIRVIPNARGQRFVLHHAHRLVIRLWVSYTPTGGVQRNIGIYGVHITP